MFKNVRGVAMSGTKESMEPPNSAPSARIQTGTQRERESGITQEYLKEILDYNPVSGEFHWKVKYSRKNNQGQLAGVLQSGYIKINIKGVFIGAHRLAWIYETGSWPKHMIDHIDCDRSNNRFANLREATKSQNMLNRGPQRNNTSGLKGVSFSKRSGLWIAQLQVKNKNYHFGYHKTKEQAAEAFKEGYEKYAGDYGWSKME